MSKINEELLQFPCHFPIKAVGLANDEFETTVLMIIKRHVYELTETAIRTQLSKNGKYLSITVTIIAQSKKQLDTIYQALTECPLVIMAL